jgi:ATP-dependent RNA helicase RhlE
VGRTARAELKGDAFTFVSPEEEADLAAIERAIGRRLPRVTAPGFDYAKRPAESLEVPLAQRIAAIRAGKAEQRRRGKEKAQRRTTTGPLVQSSRFKGEGARQPRWGRRG